MTHIIDAPRICRGCGSISCAPTFAELVLLDVDLPTGVCRACAAALNWHPAALDALGFAPSEEEAA